MLRFNVDDVTEILRERLEELPDIPKNVFDLCCLISTRYRDMFQYSLRTQDQKTVEKFLFQGEQNEKYRQENQRLRDNYNKEFLARCDLERENTSLHNKITELEQEIKCLQSEVNFVCEQRDDLAEPAAKRKKSE
jgi:cell division protein FtsB